MSLIVKDATGFREATQAEIDYVNANKGRDPVKELDALKAQLITKGVLVA